MIGAGISDTTEGTQLAVKAALETLVTRGLGTETTLAQVRDAIKAQIDLASTIWTDNSGAYYVRRDLVNQGTGAVTVTFTDAAGTAATPGAGLRPLADADRDVTQALFDATAAGTGYSSGDVLARLLIVDAQPSTPSVTAVWVNLSTGAVIAAPTGGTFERADEAVGARQVGSWSMAVSASALPAGAATELTLASLLTATAFNARTPALGAAAPSASSPVTLPNDVVVGAAASVAAININLLTGNVSDWYDASNFHSCSIQLVGAAGISAGAVFFEQTNDTIAAPGGNPWAVEEDTGLTPTPQIGAITIAANTVRMFRAPVTAKWVRVRASTAFVGGAVQAIAVFSQLPYSRMVQTVHQATAGNMQVTADTELPAAAALADAAANPTTPLAGAAALLFNGSTWDRARGMSVNLTTGDTGAKSATGNGATITNVGNKGLSLLVNLGAFVGGTSPSITFKLQGSPDGGTNWYDIPGATTAALTASGLFGITVFPGIAATAGTTTSGTVATVSQVLPRTWRVVWTITGAPTSITITSILYNYLPN